MVFLFLKSPQRSVLQVSCEQITMTLQDLLYLDRFICVCLYSCVCAHRWAHFSPLSADWSIVIGLSVSGLVLSFVLWAFCRLTQGQKRKGTGERKKGKKEGGRQRKWRMFASRRAWPTPSTKSPDIYSALLTNLKKSSSLSVSPFFIHTPHWRDESVCVLVCMC